MMSFRSSSLSSIRLLSTCLLVLAACLSVVGAVRAEARQDEPLSLPQAVRIAMEIHPQIVAARYRVDALAGLEVSVSAEKNPQLQVVPVGTLNDNTVIVSQSVQDPGKRKVQAMAAHSEVIVARARLREMELDIASDVSRAYVGLHEALRAKALMEEAIVLATTLHRLAYSRFELGDVPLIHVTRTEIEVNRLLQDLERAKADVEISAAKLNGAMGREASVPITLAGLPGFDERDYDPTALKKFAMAHRPEILAAERAVQIRQYNVKLAQKEWVPDLLLQARTGERTGGVEGTQVGVGIIMPVWDWGSIRGKVQSARAQITEQEALLAKTRNEVEIQVDAAFRNLRTARSIAEAYERSLVPRAEGMVRILQESYEQGGTTLFEIIEAQHMLTSVRLEHLKAAAAYFRSVADLVRAAGGDGFMRDSSPGTQSGGERKP